MTTARDARIGLVGFTEFRMAEKDLSRPGFPESPFVMRLLARPLG